MILVTQLGLRATIHIDYNTFEECTKYRTLLFYFILANSFYLTYNIRIKYLGGFILADNRAVPITITIKPDVLEKLDSFAEDFGISRSGMIAVLVKNRVREDEAMKMTNDFKEMLSKMSDESSKA